MPFATSILVPTDFSSKSEIAIRYACEIARTTSTELHFLNVIEPPYDFPSRAEEILQAQKEEHAEKLTRLIDELHSVDDYRSIKIKGQVEIGKVGYTISHVAEEKGFDLITIGLGGEPHLKKALYGSITNNLLLDSSVPVFAISKRLDYKDPKYLIFSTALREGDIRQIKRMRNFARDLGVSLRIIHIREKGKAKPQLSLDEFQKKVQGALKDDSIQVEEYESTSFVEGVTTFIEDNKNSILVMTRYKKKFLEWLLSDSTVRSVAQIAAVPLLMLPND
ncbi:MAG: universal stress protein [Balneolaceae bacterium]